MKVVQIGSNKGNDDLSNYLLNNFETLEFGLFVEANPFHRDDLKTCYSKYSNAIVEILAIKTPLQKETELELFYHTNEHPNYQITTCNLEHLLSHMSWCPHLQGGEVKSFVVDCITLEELLDKYQITYLDWILLDVEGMDAEILLTFDWKKYKIRKVEFEHLHLGEHKDFIENMFLEMGYERVNSLHEYDWAFENKNITESDFGEDWFSYSNLYSEIVNKFKSGSRFVEIGCWKGRSASYMCDEIANSKKDIEFFCVDIWEETDKNYLESLSVFDTSVSNGNNLYDTFINNMKSYEKYYFPLKMSSLDAAKKFKDNSLDFVFIDASHEYEDVKDDIKAWLPKVKPGGILAGHDYYHNEYDWYPGVKKAVNELLSNFDIREQCWVYYKPDKSKLKNLPPVHYISVDYCTERREKLHQKFSEFGIKNITGHIFEKYDDTQHKIISDYIDRLSIGSRGPVTSHLKAIKQWYDNTTEEVAFFCEDDLSMDLIQYWNFTWDDFYNNLPDDWEIVQLAWLRYEFNTFKIGFRNRCWCDWSGCAYIIKREFAKKLIDTYYYDGKFHLDVKGADIHLRADWAKIPVIETIIFSPLGKVYGAPLFTEDLSFMPSYLNPNTEEGKKQPIHPAHEESYKQNINWWRNIGSTLTIEEFMGE